MEKIKHIFFIMLAVLLLANAEEEIPVSHEEEKIIVFHEDENCNFNEIVLSGKSENYKHIVGIVLGVSNNRVLVKPIHEQNYKKLIIELNKKIKLVEEIEFFILDDNKVCINKRVIR